jgi:hypothetical protein
MKTFLLLILSCSMIYFTNSLDCKDNYIKDCPPTTTPVWPDQFEQSFEETFTYPVFGSHTTKGKFFYDWTNKRYRVDRENGHYDRYCLSIYPFSNTPCSHIVSEGDRYLYFPEKDYCCNCCSNEHGCGILKPDWMDSATFIDYVTESDGVIYEKWDKKGLQSNFYFASAKDRVMRRITQEPNDIQEFDTSSFKSQITDSTIFNLPAKCKKTFMCPTLSVCTAVRNYVNNLAFLQ